MNKHIEEFKRQGFAILPQLASVQEIDSLLGQAHSVLKYALKSSGYQMSDVDRDQLYCALKEKDPALKSRAYDLIQHLDGAFRISAKERLLSFIEELTGTPLLIDYVSIRVDDSSNDRQLPFHQEFFGQISAECYTAWIPLQDINESTGGLRVVPGSHTQGAVKHRFYGNYHGVREENLHDARPVNLTLKRGDALVFHPYLFHGTAPSNGQNTIRWTLVTRYNALKDIPYIEKSGAPLRIEQLEH